MTGIVFGCLVPHPPIIVPDIGKGQESQVADTIRALEKVNEALARVQPQAVVIISPHGQSHPDAMGIVTAPSCTGSLAEWGARAPEHRFANDLPLVSLITEEAKAAKVPLRPMGQKGYVLDHGVMVPMHYLHPALENVPLVPLTFSWLPLSAHFDFGKAIARAARRSGKRIAVIASGDLSHRLIPEAPAGYDPKGKVFDAKLVAALRDMDTETVLDLDSTLIERAGECGLRSIVILLGALDGARVKPHVLSYEGPFGVGYAVAMFEVAAGPPEPPSHPLARLAKETVESYIRTGKVPRPEAATPDMKEKAGVFVCLKKHGELRGCIGTYEATTPDVASETAMNSVSAAVRDPRFPPVEASELPDLEYTVDVLTRAEPVKDTADLDPKKHGIIVQCGYRRGLLLPDLEGVDTVDEQIKICCSKAGIIPGEPLTLYCFQVKRYK